jgi:TRAP transporter 4TM/12TM fusion protein
MGEVLLITGGAGLFIELATRLAGRSVGGPAKVAVIASSMFGMLSGAPAANASVTGNFTIPLMKRRGYTPEYAAAVEAVASSGSQIMPPVMGAAAFVMAEFLGVPYQEIILAALVPAVIFYATVFFNAHLHGKREGIAGSEEAMPAIDGRWIWALLSTFVLPITLLLVIMFQGGTASKGAFWAIVAAVLVYLLGDPTVKGLRERGRRVLTGLVNGGRSVVLIALLAGAAQIVVGLIGLTGFGVKLSAMIISASGGVFFFALFLSALTAMVLGMGMPTTAVYILVAAVIAPALIDFGVLPIAAHMFLFYFGIVAAITPPVCVAVFVTAGIAQADWLRTSWDAMKIGLATFVVPFIFIYHSELLLIGKPLNIAVAIATALLGTFSMSAGTTGWLRGRLNPLESILAIAFGILLIIPDTWMSIAGAAGLIGLWLYKRPGSQPKPERNTLAP